MALAVVMCFRRLVRVREVVLGSCALLAGHDCVQHASMHEVGSQGLVTVADGLALVLAGVALALICGREVLAVLVCWPETRTMLPDALP